MQGSSASLGASSSPPRCCGAEIVWQNRRFETSCVIKMQGSSASLGASSSPQRCLQHEERVAQSRCRANKARPHSCSKERYDCCKIQPGSKSKPTAVSAAREEVGEQHLGCLVEVIATGNKRAEFKARPASNSRCSRNSRPQSRFKHTPPATAAATAGHKADSSTPRQQQPLQSQQLATKQI
eukprot:1160992-Pelagomonas_calceolata.AAC.10